MKHFPKIFLTLILLFFSATLLYAQASEITATTATANQPTTLTFTGTLESEGYLLRYDWIFGDTQTTTTATPTTTHTYTEAGTYTVTLTINGTVDLGEDWNISSDWETTFGTYNTTVYVGENQSEAAQVHSSLINNMYLVIGLLSTALIILASMILISTMRSGEANLGAGLLVSGLIVGAVVNLVIGFVIINSLTNVGGF